MPKHDAGTATAVESARGFASKQLRSSMQPDIIGNADAVPQLPERCLSRKAGIVRCCLK